MNNSKLKRIFAVLLCAAFTAATFTACGPENGSSSETSTASSAVSSTSSGTVSSEAAVESSAAEPSAAESSQAEVQSGAPSDDPNWLTSEDASPEKEREILEQLDDLATSLAAGTPSTPTVGASDVPAPGNYTGAISVKTPTASGTTVYQQGGSVIDASNTSDGYVMVKNSGSDKRLKVQIKCGSMTYNYDLNNGGNYEVFPLQMGNGGYTVRIMENVTGSSYKELYHADFTVALKSTNEPFLYPNQYVNYTASSAAVKKSYDLCMNAKSDLDKLKAVYNFMITNVKYDYDKAKTVKSGYLPNVDTILSTKKGICFDYSALMITMLRAQGVPAKMVCGSAGPEADNHAWTEIFLEGTGWITVKIENTATGWKLMDPTFGASGSTGSSYTAARVY